MLRSLKNFERYHVMATDGEIGKIIDFYFDDTYWSLRYLVVDTGGLWAGPHRVLISPIAFRKVDGATRRFHLELTRAEVRNSPTVEVDEPISKSYEREYSQYYGWPYYWGFAASWTTGICMFPSSVVARAHTASMAAAPAKAGDPHLRSAKTVTGYHIQGSDDEIGHVADLLVDDEDWKIRYLVINTSNWWWGSKVLVGPGWAQAINWQKSKIYLGLPREAIRDSPSWQSADSGTAMQRAHGLRSTHHQV